MLAGGKGSRMLPITSSLPKPLIPAPKVPMIQKILEQLIRFNFTEVYLLTGYKAKYIKDFVTTLNLPIDVFFIESNEEMAPANRILFAREFLPAEYLLLYCDNFVSDEDLRRHLQNISFPEKSLTMLVEKRKIGNIGIQNSTVLFSPNDRKENTPYVELGYLAVSDASFFHSVLEKFEDMHVTFEYFSREKKLKANVLTEMFISISNLQRYRELRKSRDTVLLDRDGILNVKMPKADYVKSWDDLDLIEEVWDTLDNTSLENDIDYLVITNQPGVARGLVRGQFLDELHTFMSVNALKRGINLLAYYVCIHGWNDSCTCRKPLPGLIEKAKLDFELNPDRIFFVGDDERDMVAANLGNVEGKLVHATRDFHVIWKEVMSGLGKVS